MSRRTLLRVALVFAFVVIGSGSVMAGLRGYAPLSEYMDHAADGGFGDTYNTPDDMLYAECGSNASAGFCTMRFADGTYKGCLTTDPGMIEVIRSMSGDSLFNILWDDNGQCTYLMSYASSRGAPKKP